MKDRFQTFSNAAVVTPSDTLNLTPPALELLVVSTAAGVVKVDTPNQVGVLIPAQAGYTRLPVVCTRVYATGTTVSGGSIVAVW